MKKKILATIAAITAFQTAFADGVETDYSPWVSLIRHTEKAPSSKTAPATKNMVADGCPA